MGRRSGSVESAVSESPGLIRLRTAKSNSVSSINSKVRFGIEGYKVPKRNSGVDDRLSTANAKSRFCQNKDNYSLHEFLRTKSVIPAPNKYSLPEFAIPQKKLFPHDRITIFSETMKNLAPMTKVSPFTYKPEVSVKVKGSLKQSQPRITMVEEYMTSEASKIPGAKYLITS